MPGRAPAPAPAFVARLGAHGDRVAVLADGEALTYAELDDRAREVADRLGPTRRLVLIGAANAVDALVAYLGALRGGHPVLLVPGDDERAVATATEAYEPDVVMAAGGGWAVDQRHPGSAHDLHPDLALLLSTSGSTGSSKLVRLSRRNLQANAEAIATYLGITAHDRAVTTLPMQYCYGLSVIHSHLLRGGGLVLTDLSVVDRCLWDLFRASGATSFAGVPHTFDMLDRVGFEAQSLPTLRYITQAGGRLDPATVRRYARLGGRRGWQLYVMYGQTEATARMAYLPPELAESHAHTVGVPVPGGSFTIDDPDDDGVGELVYHGPNVMLGYAETPADLALGATVDALRTGDLARRTPEGLYELRGRRSRFVKLFGLRVDLDRVERLLADHGITGLCAGDDQRLVVAVASGHDPVATRDLVAERVGVPRSRVRVVACPDGLPRLANGKPDHVAVRRIAEEPGPAGEPGGVDAAVAAAFADILGVTPAARDTFVGLGGDSLSYVEMSTRLERCLGHLPPDWHTTPVGRLVSSGGRSRRFRRAETGVVLRALAIVLIVGNHAGLWNVAGSAHLLLGVAGYNFARFQLGAGGRGMRLAVARIALPAVAWLGLVAVASDQFSWRHALLLNGVLGPRDARWGYWYVEAIVHILVVVALLLAVPAVRRAERRWPFGLPLLATAAALTVRFDLVDLPAAHHRLYRPQEIVWLFTLGWAAARARTAPRRLVVSAAVLVSVPGFFVTTSRDALVAAGLLALVWVPTLPVPRPASRPVSAVAAASLYIYLTHWQVYPPLVHHGRPVALVGSLLFGVVAWRAVRWGSAAVPAALAGRGAREGRGRRPTSRPGRRWPGPRPQPQPGRGPEAAPGVDEPALASC